MEHLDMNNNALKSTPLGLNLIANTVETLHFDHNTIHSLTSMEGVTFSKLCRLNLQYNNITRLHPELLITPQLESLNLVGNHLVSLADVTLYSWGSLLPEHKYLAIHLQQNPWHCNVSLVWMFSNLYEGQNEIIYVKPPFKPLITNVDQLLCQSPDERHGTTVLSADVIESVKIRIRSLHELAGKCCSHIALNRKCNFTHVTTSNIRGTKSHDLTYWGRVTLICVTKLFHHWIR